ncbi:MAG: DUF6901 family protein [Desulfatibacillaceae bacterium]
MEPIRILYRFRFEDGRVQELDLRMDPERIELVENRPEPVPKWCELGFHQCPHCPLSTKKRRYCPLALNLVNVVSCFDGVMSHNQTELEVCTAERFTSQKTTVQRGVSSLMGLVMATSGCPHAAFFKPMARFHLPLSSEDETIYRAASMYLLAQFFLNRETRHMDMKLRGLSKIYHNMEIVNTTMAQRLRAATQTDSAVNALVLLDLYAKTLPFVIEESLEKIRYLFEPFFRYMKKVPPGDRPDKDDDGNR